MSKKLKIISVGGPIGVGKTTYINNKLQEDKLNGVKSKAIYELFEDNKNSIFEHFTTRDKIMNIFLELYYSQVDLLNSPKDEEREIALLTTLGHQTNFLANRANKIIEGIRLAKKLNLDVLYLDRTIFEDIIFTKRNLFNEPLYWNSYQQVWDKWLNLLEYHLTDLEVENIILTANVETILGRIKKRGREMEQSPELEDYFRDLTLNYVKELKSNFIMCGWKFKILNNED